MKRDDLELSRAEIFRGRQHKLVFLELEEKSLMVSEIMRKINSKIKDNNQLRLRDVSRALKWLAENKYAECLNPSSKHGVKGIIYRLSNEGKKIKNHLNKKVL